MLYNIKTLYFFIINDYMCAPPFVNLIKFSIKINDMYIFCEKN